MALRSKKAPPKERGRWGARVKKAYHYVGTKTWCPDCRNMVPSREWATHVEGHVIVEGTSRQRWRNRNPPNDLKTKERTRRGARMGKPPDPRKRAQRQKREDSQTKTALNDHDQKVARAWDKRARELERLAQGQGGTGMSGANAALAQAAGRWGDVVPQTHDELKQHLIGSSGAFKAIAIATRHFCEQGLVGQKIHPAIAKPIEMVADTIDEERIYFTRAYVIFVRIYQNRIEYEDQNGPKPEDKFWKK